LVDALVEDVEKTLATIELELEAGGGEVEVELEGYLSERGRVLLDELVQELELEGNEAELSIEKEIDWGNYRSTIDIGTVVLGTENGVVRAESNPRYGFVREPELEDRDGNGLPELMVKFDRRALIGIVDVGEQLVKVSGRIENVPFLGQTSIRVR